MAVDLEKMRIEARKEKSRVEAAIQQEIQHTRELKRKVSKLRELGQDTSATEAELEAHIVETTRIGKESITAIEKAAKEAEAAYKEQQRAAKAFAQAAATGHVTSKGEIISKEYWESLSPELQDLLHRGGAGRFEEKGLAQGLLVEVGPENDVVPTDYYENLSNELQGLLNEVGVDSYKKEGIAQGLLTEVGPDEDTVPTQYYENLSNEAKELLDEGGIEALNTRFEEIAETLGGWEEVSMEQVLEELENLGEDSELYKAIVELGYKPKDIQAMGKIVKDQALASDNLSVSLSHDVKLTDEQVEAVMTAMSQGALDDWSKYNTFFKHGITQAQWTQVQEAVRQFNTVPTLTSAGYDVWLDPAAIDQLSTQELRDVLGEYTGYDIVSIAEALLAGDIPPQQQDKFTEALLFLNIDYKNLQSASEFVHSNIHLEIGEWVNREFYNLLPASLQQKLSEVGLDKFEEFTNDLEKQLAIEGVDVESVVSAALGISGTPSKRQQEDIYWTITIYGEDNDAAGAAAELYKLDPKEYSQFKEATEFIDKNVLLSSGDWVDQEAYLAMPEDEQVRLNRLGVEGYQKWFEGNHLKLKAGEYIAKDDFEAMSKEYQEKLTELGSMAKFQEWFDKNHVSIGREFITKDTWDSLSPEDQNTMQQLGVSGYQDWFDTHYMEIGKGEWMPKDDFEELPKVAQSLVMANGIGALAMEGLSPEKQFDKMVELELIPKKTQFEGVDEEGNVQYTWDFDAFKHGVDDAPEGFEWQDRFYEPLSTDPDLKRALVEPSTFKVFSYLMNQVQRLMGKEDKVLMLVGTHQAKDYWLHVAEMTVPGVWARNWGVMPTWERAVNIAIDAVFLGSLMLRPASAAARTLLRTGLGRSPLRTLTKLTTELSNAIKAGNIQAIHKVSAQIISFGNKLEKQGVSAGKEIANQGRMALREAEFIATVSKRLPNSLRKFFTTGMNKRIQEIRVQMASNPLGADAWRKPILTGDGKRVRAHLPITYEELKAMGLNQYEIEWLANNYGRDFATFMKEVRAALMQKILGGEQRAGIVPITEAGRKRLSLLEIPASKEQLKAWGISEEVAKEIVKKTGMNVAAFEKEVQAFLKRQQQMWASLGEKDWTKEVEKLARELAASPEYKPFVMSYDHPLLQMLREQLAEATKVVSRIVTKHRTPSRIAEALAKYAEARPKQTNLLQVLLEALESLHPAKAQKVFDALVRLKGMEALDILKKMGKDPIKALRQIIEGKLFEAALAANPSAIAKLLLKVEAYLRTQYLATLSPALRAAVQNLLKQMEEAKAVTQAITKVQTLAKTELKLALKLSLLTKTQLATKLQTLPLTKTQTKLQTKTKTKLALLPKIVTKTALKLKPMTATTTALTTKTRFTTKGRVPIRIGRPIKIKKKPIRPPLPRIEEKPSKGLTEKQKKGSVAWRQGLWYILIYPPYGKEHIIYSKKPFPGIRMTKGAGSAYRSIGQPVKGILPPLIKRDMGVVDIRITTPKKGKDRGRKPKIEFIADPKQETTLTGVR